MNDTYLVRTRKASEHAINDKLTDFTAKFFAVYHLHTLSETHPEIMVPETVSALAQLIQSPEFSRQRQGLFLFREAANTLVSIFTKSNGNSSLTDQADQAIKTILATTVSHAHRAMAESLGDLPVSIHATEPEDIRINHVPLVGMEDILAYKKIKISHPPVYKGRSLVAALNPSHQLLVIKFARSGESPDALHREACWMNYFSSCFQAGACKQETLKVLETFKVCEGRVWKRNDCFPHRFNIPCALNIENSYVIRLKGIPISRSQAGVWEREKDLNLHPKKYAICFIADRDYFTYPNTGGAECLTDDEFREVICRNAWLLGKLTGSGIIHTAPIPLFHNRVQRDRRRDHGLYEWFRAGRLDRWLESCAYPNIGVTGIRDFEHLIPFTGSSKELYRYMGSHFLSLMLIIGSYFRNKEPNQVGFDAQGNPADARALFDISVLKCLIHEIFLSYYNGFTGTTFSGEIPVHMDVLASRMVEEMGVDRHMEEMLRVADQAEMSHKEFKAFLRRRGYAEDELKNLQKGVSDIVIYSGPHLGGFNQPISLPELITTVETLSALCMLGRYLTEKKHHEKNSV